MFVNVVIIVVRMLSSIVCVAGVVGLVYLGGRILWFYGYRGDLARASDVFEFIVLVSGGNGF